jgi:hypothetical protein
MAGTVVADTLQADSTSTLVLKNGVANTPPTIQDSAGTQIGTFCRAWVNFNGQGTVAIRASFNVTSITDGGVGTYTVNFTNAMPDVNYAAICSIARGGLSTTTPTGDSTWNGATGSMPIICANSLNSTIDPPAVFVAIFR